MLTIKPSATFALTCKSTQLIHSQITGNVSIFSGRLQKTLTRSFPCTRYCATTSHPCSFACKMAPGAPTVVLTVRGDEPKLKSVLLSSHMDVVPVTAEDWDCDPFAAHMTADRDIVARGAQDMKCVGIGYIAAMRQLRNQPRRRTIHLVFTPDEEIGSARGAALFANSDAFAALNVGVCLDEGCPSPHERVFVFNAERSAWCTHHYHLASTSLCRDQTDGPWRRRAWKHHATGHRGGTIGTIHICHQKRLTVSCEH